MGNITILGHYKFEGNANDSSGNLNHGEVLGATVSDGIIGRGYSFTRVDENDATPVVIPNLNNETDYPYFISCWIQPSNVHSGGASTGQRIFSRTSTQVTIIYNDTVRTNTQSSITGAQLSFPVTVNTKYHIVSVYTEDTVYMYVNGNLIGSATNNTNNIPTINDFTIGGGWIIANSAYGRGFEGIIDEFIIGTGVPELSDVKRMMLGLHPIYQIPFNSSYEIFRNNVLRDGGIFDDAIFRSEWNKLDPKLRKESTSLIVPGAYKEGVIYAMNCIDGSLVPWNFTRASSATYFDRNLQLKTVGVNMPRINHNIVTGECEGYMFEPLSTNLINNSTFNGGSTNSWNIHSSVTTEHDADITFYGRNYLRITKMEPTTNSYIQSNTIQSVENTTYIARVTIKGGTLSDARLNIGNDSDPGGSNTNYGGNDYTNGRIIKGPGTITNNEGRFTISGLSTTEDTIVEIERTYINSDINIRLRIWGENTNALGFIKIANPQLEVKNYNYSLSYIDTTNAPVTRSFETSTSAVPVTTGEMSIYMDAIEDVPLNITATLADLRFSSSLRLISSGTLTNYIAFSGFTNNLSLTVYVNRSSRNKTVITWNNSTPNKTACMNGNTVISNNIAGINENAVVNLSYKSMSNVGKLNIVKTLAFIPRQLTNQEQQDLTIL